MPIYEYDCPDCGRIEVIQKFSDEPFKECPNCLTAGKHNAVQKLISLASFHLKGTGWYKTDYASSNSNGAQRNGHGAKAAATETKADDKAKSGDEKTGAPEKAKEAKSDAPSKPSGDSTD